MTDQGDPAKYHLPEKGPSADDVRERDAWNAVVAASPAVAQATAEKWRTGLAGFVTLVTAGLFIKGPESASDLTPGWRLLITVLLGGGLAIAILGLWAALRAAAGTAKQTSLDQVLRNYGSVEAMQVALASRTADRVGWARKLIAGALVLLGAGLIVWWWAPTAPVSPPAYLTVTRAGQPAQCGELLSGDEQKVVLAVNGQAAHVTVRYRDITNIALVASC